MDDEDDKQTDGVATELEKVLAKKNELLDEVKTERRKRQELEAKFAEIEAEKQRIADQQKEAEAKAAGMYEEYMKNKEAALRAELSEAIAAKDKEANEWKSRYVDKEKNIVLNSALEDVNVSQPLKKAAALLISSSMIVEEIDGQVLISCVNDGVKMPVKEYVKMWAETSEGKAFVAAPANGGGGGFGGKTAGVTGGKNPWKKGEINLTEQMRLMKQNPVLAETLKRSAG